MSSRTFDFMEPRGDYARLRAEQPVWQTTSTDGKKVWWVSRFADVCLTLGDEEHWRKTKGDCTHGSLSSMNTADYSIHRDILEKAFSLERMSEIERDIEKIVDDLLDQFARQTSPVDFVSQFATKVPFLTMYHLLGIPASDDQFVRERIGHRSSELRDYLHRLVEQKKHTPKADLISRLVIEQVCSLSFLHFPSNSSSVGTEKNQSGTIDRIRSRLSRRWK